MFLIQQHFIKVTADGRALMNNHNLICKRCNYLSMAYTQSWFDWSWLCFYQTRSAWSMDQGSNRKQSAVHNFAPTITKFCVMWEGQALPHDTKFGNSRYEIEGRRVIFIWSLIHGSSWSGLIKAEPGVLGFVNPNTSSAWPVYRRQEPTGKGFLQKLVKNCGQRRTFHKVMSEYIWLRRLQQNGCD